MREDEVIRSAGRGAEGKVYSRTANHLTGSTFESARHIAPRLQAVAYVDHPARAESRSSGVSAVYCASLISCDEMIFVRSEINATRILNGNTTRVFVEVIDENEKNHGGAITDIIYQSRLLHCARRDNDNSNYPSIP